MRHFILFLIFSSIFIVCNCYSEEKGFTYPYPSKEISFPYTETEDKIIIKSAQEKLYNVIFDDLGFL